MTAWAKPADLLIAYKFASASEWRVHMITLEEWGYPYMAQLRKELARGESKGRGRNGANAKAGPAPSFRTSRNDGLHTQAHEGIEGDGEEGHEPAGALFAPEAHTPVERGE